MGTRAATRPFLCYLGFGMMLASSFLYENLVLLSNVASFNYTQYANLAQLSVLAAGAIASAVRRWRPGTAFVRICAAAAFAGVVVQLLAGGAAVGIACAAMQGAAMGALMLAWGQGAAALDPRRVAACVFSFMLAGTLLCCACSFAPSQVGVLVCIGLMLVSALLYNPDACESVCRLGLSDTGRPAAAGASGEDVPGLASSNAQPAALLVKRLPWPFLATLAVCCLISALFAGMTLNPYSFQSQSVSRFLYVFELATFIALLMCSLLQQRPQAHLFLIVGAVLLVAGLLLFSNGLLGSIIMPLGLILAAKSCCVAVAWITLVMLVRTSGLPGGALLGAGLLLCNGTLGRGAGMLFSSHANVGFPEIALAASLAIGTFTLFYVVVLALNPKAGQAWLIFPTQPDAGAEDEGQAVDVPEDPFELFDFTAQELRIARRIVDGCTYREISDQLHISERTVKFHAKNVFVKAGTETRHDFELIMKQPQQVRAAARARKEALARGEAENHPQR